MSIAEALPQNPVDADHKSRFDDEVADAALLLDYAISTGVAGPNGRKVDDALIDAIKAAQDLASKGQLPSADDRAKFEKAYRDLARFMSPINAETLKATSELHGVKSALVALIRPRPIGIVWSRKLSLWTLLFVVIALLGDFIDTFYGELPEPLNQSHDKFPLLQAAQLVLHILVPFTYGAIGACTYLLKACQKYIHMRQFDPLRISEYYNRMILGAISGGIIVLLVHQIAGTGDTTIRFSAAALGFLAGYNNDLLFGAIERISAAILPKIGISSVQTQKPRNGGGATIEDVSLKDLLDRHQSATDPDDKKVYAALIQRLQDRL